MCIYTKQSCAWLSECNVFVYLYISGVSCSEWERAERITEKFLQDCDQPVRNYPRTWYTGNYSRLWYSEVSLIRPPSGPTKSGLYSKFVIKERHKNYEILFKKRCYKYSIILSISRRWVHFVVRNDKLCIVFTYE